MLKYWPNLLGLLVGVGAMLAATLADFGVALPEAPSWQSQVAPGQLSAAHAQLATTCAACHTAVKSIDVAKCVSCHAGNKGLLQRQPTAFHATIGNCASCHVEHLGADANLRVMNHEALARIGARQVPGVKVLARQNINPLLPAGHPLVSPLVALLDCATCHGTKDRHAGLFGTKCAACHGTDQWTIPAFQHPPLRSTDCVQCHQAPPSHYMMHFEVIDKQIAARGKTQDDGQDSGCCGGVVVAQCYKCHQTTAWNDIKGVGFYKHH